MNSQANDSLSSESDLRVNLPSIWAHVVMAKLSVIVAVFNEELRLRSFVEKLISSPCPIEREFIFIDDGSQDDTHSCLTQLSEEFPLQVIKQEKNQCIC